MFRKILKSKVFSLKKGSFFSTSLPESLQKTRKRLLKALKYEIDHEMKNNFIDNSIENTLKELEFELVDNEYEKSMDLKKETDEYRLQIRFDCRSPNKLLEEIEENEDKKEKNIEKKQTNEGKKGKNETMEESQEECKEIKSFFMILAKFYSK